jgi:hypothetical protein
MAVDVSLRTSGYQNPLNPTSSQPGGATTYYADVLADLQTLLAAVQSGSFSSMTISGNLTVTGNVEVDGTIQHDGGTLTTADKNILLNKGGTTAGAVGAGISIEGDAAAEVGYIKTGAADNSILTIKVPGNAGVMTLDINATKTWTVGGALNVSADSAINQDVGTGASPVWESPTVAVLNTGNGAVGTPSVKVGGGTKGLYHVSDTQLGVSIGGSLSTVFVDDALLTNEVRARVEPGTAGTNVTAVSTGDGRNYVTVLTLANASLGAPTAGGNSAHGALVYTFPAGVHVHYVSYFDIGLTIGGVTTDTPDVGLGSVIGAGAVATLDGTPTFEDYITGQTWNVALDGTAKAVGPLGATAGVLTGISLNAAASVKALNLNAADGWNGAVTGNLTASGTITVVWSILS